MNISRHDVFRFPSLQRKPYIARLAMRQPRLQVDDAEEVVVLCVIVDGELKLMSVVDDVAVRQVNSGAQKEKRARATHKTTSCFQFGSYADLSLPPFDSRFGTTLVEAFLLGVPGLETFLPAFVGEVPNGSFAFGAATPFATSVVSAIGSLDTNSDWSKVATT